MGLPRGSKVSARTQKRIVHSFHPHCIRLPVPINLRRGLVLISIPIIIITIQVLAGTVTRRLVRFECSKTWECTAETTARRYLPGINIRRRISIIIRILTVDISST